MFLLLENISLDKLVTWQRTWQENGRTFKRNTRPEELPKTGNRRNESPSCSSFLLFKLNRIGIILYRLNKTEI